MAVKIFGPEPHRAIMVQTEKSAGLRFIVRRQEIDTTPGEHGQAPFGCRRYTTFEMRL